MYDYYFDEDWTLGEYETCTIGGASFGDIECGFDDDFGSFGDYECGCDYDISDAGVSSAGTAEYSYTHKLLRTGVVSDLHI